MKNTPVGAHEAEDLRRLVERVLRDVGNPEPPLDLRVIREALRLDLQFFSLEDPTFLQRAAHKFRVGAKQVIARPGLIIEAVRKANITGIFQPDEKRIIIDSGAPQLKHRWIEAHEIGHSLAPWHQCFMFGDNDETLLPSCHDELEREANFAAGQLTFLQSRFVEEACDSTASLGVVRALASAFGNTITSTLWRFVEEAHKDEALVGIVERKGEPKSGVPREYCIESPAFREMFGQLDEPSLLAAVRQCKSPHRKLGNVGEGNVTLVDDNGGRHLFQFECWANKYYTLSLGQYVRPVQSSVAVPPNGTGADG